MKFGALQNLKDKFLSRGGGRIGSYVLSAYGKLPIYKDYIIWECHLGGTAEFKRWLDEAFGMAWEDLGGKSVRLRGPVRGLLLLPSGKQAIASLTWPSSDEGGLRIFPFTLFTCFSRGDIVGRGLRGAIEAMEPVWRSFEAEYKAIQGCANIEDLYAYFQRSSPCLEETAVGEEAPLELGEWMKMMEPASPAGLRQRLEEGARRTLAAYRSFPEQGESLAVRLPLARDAGAGAQAEVWEQVFKDNLKKCPVFPSVVIEPDREERYGTICLAWRPLRREDARLFAEAIEAYEFVEDLVPGGPISTDPGAETIEAATDLKQWTSGLGK